MHKLSILFLSTLLLAAYIGAVPRSALKQLPRLHRDLNQAHEDTTIKEPRDIPEYRLPTSLEPVHQLVRLQPFVNGNFTINGYTELNFTVLSATPNITIHMFNMEHDNVIVEESLSGTQMTVVNHMYDPVKKFFIAEMETDLVVGETYTLKMSYVAELLGSLNGFYLSSYTNVAGETVNLAVTQFEATEARRAFPCFDEPSFKARFTTEIIREESMVAVSNMPLVSSETLPNGWVLDRFDTSVVMSSYLNAYLVSSFIQQNTTVDDVLYRVWAPENVLTATDYSLEVLPTISMFFENYFNVPFALPKQDMVAIPDFLYGAMENWGLITYATSAMLYVEELAPIWQKERVCRIVSHELAHMWFGNTVTLEWWEFVWLNEGFANFFEYIGCDAAEPTFSMREIYLRAEMQYVLGVDDVDSTHPLVVDINDPNNIMSNFDSISYSKGGSLVRMMQYFLSEATFIQGLTNYLNTYAFSNANQDNLFEILNAQAVADGIPLGNLTVKTIMDSWTLQKGHPVINITRAPDGTAVVTQERFLMDPSSTDLNVERWYVPLTYTTQSNPNFNQFDADWMLPGETEKTIQGLPSQSEWVIFNIQQGAFFRTKYDSENYLAIATQLNTDHSVIHFLNRAQLINDAYNLARAGYITYDVPFDLTAYLGQETEYVVIDAALEDLNFIDQMFRRLGNFQPLTDFLTSILVPIYNDVGFTDSPNDPFLDQMKRTDIVSWVCYLEYGPCVTNSTSQYTQLMANPSDNSIVTPSSLCTVYCSSIRDGGENEWDFAFEKYLNATTDLEREDLIYAMGCTLEDWILARFLDRAFNSSSGIRTSDIRDVVNSASSTFNGEDVTWGYINDNDDNIAAYMGSYSFVAQYVSIVARSFNTDARLQELQDFQTANADDLTSSGSSIDGAIETTQYNIEWVNEYYDVILTWLNTNHI